MASGSALTSQVMGFQLENSPFLAQLLPTMCRVCSVQVRQPGIPGPPAMSAAPGGSGQFLLLRSEKSSEAETRT